MWNQKQKSGGNQYLISRITSFQKMCSNYIKGKGFKICLGDCCGVKKLLSREDCIYATNMQPFTTYIYCIVPFILKCFTNWFTNSVYCNHFHFWNALHPLCIRIFHFMNFRIWHSNPQISLWVWNTVYGFMKTTWQIAYSGFCDKSVFSVSGALIEMYTSTCRQQKTKNINWGLMNGWCIS